MFFQTVKDTRSDSSSDGTVSSSQESRNTPTHDPVLKRPLSEATVNGNGITHTNNSEVEDDMDEDFDLHLKRE